MLYIAILICRSVGHGATVAEDLARHRDGYEARFRALVDSLALPDDVDRGHLRRFLLGALNWSRHWYRPGADTPAAIADALLACVRDAGPERDAQPGEKRR